MARTKGANEAVGRPRITRRTGDATPQGLMTFRLLHGVHHEGKNVYAPKGVNWPGANIVGDTIQSFRRLDKVWPGRFVLISKQQTYPTDLADEQQTYPEGVEGVTADDEGALAPEVTGKDEEKDLQAMTKREIVEYAKETYGANLNKKSNKAVLILEVQELGAANRKR